MIIQYINQQTRYPVKPWKELLQQVLPQGLLLLPFGRKLAQRGIEAQLTLVFAGPRIMRRINRETRQVDKLTDVLSFPMLDMERGELRQALQDHDFDLQSGKVLPLGEIVLSLDQALQQASEYGHPDEREIAFLAVHGLLHLLGFDHQDSREEKAMQRWQRRILAAQDLGRAGVKQTDPEPMEEAPLRSGFVSLIGRPNSGKSTLLNQLAGMHLAITSPKAQTTRQVVRAIVDRDDSQIIFLDTPGLHNPKNRLGQFMMEAATAALSDGDVILLLVDAAQAIRSEAQQVPGLEQDLLKRAAIRKKPVILLLNKVDLVVKEKLLPLMAAYAKAYPFAALIPVSAKTGDGIDSLLQTITRLMPYGPRYYPADTLTDQSERDLAAELIREQILFLTSEEIPHGTAVEIESFEEYASNAPASDDSRTRVHISAVIYCDKESHKGILIGRKGSVLKKIGTAARLQIEKMLGCPCFLALFVKVREDWRNRAAVLRNLGFSIRE